MQELLTQVPSISQRRNGWHLLLAYFALAAQRALGAWDVVLTRIVANSYSQGSSACLEDPFGDVVAVATVVQQDVIVAESVAGEGIPEVFDELAIKFPNLGGRNRSVEDDVVATA